MRCHECGVLEGRDHHYDCQSYAARRQWDLEEKKFAADCKVGVGQDD